MAYFRTESGGGAEPIVWASCAFANNGQIMVSYKTFDDSITCNNANGGQTNPVIFTFANAFKGTLYASRVQRTGNVVSTVTVNGTSTTLSTQAQIYEIALDLPANSTIEIKAVSGSGANAVGVLITK